MSYAPMFRCSNSIVLGLVLAVMTTLALWALCHLNVVNFIEALEDDEDVHIIMELCTGGELAHSLAKRHYSERTVIPGP